MLEVRRGLDRGYADHGWSKSYHTFSFADYYDPVYEDYGVLRGINEDRVKAGTGFANRAQRDMDMLTYLLAGELQHQDSLGTVSILKPGEVQRVSAGSGITESE